MWLCTDVYEHVRYVGIYKPSLFQNGTTQKIFCKNFKKGSVKLFRDVLLLIFNI